MYCSYLGAIYHSYCVIVDAVNSDDIEVLGCGVISWKPPQGQEGVVLGYVVRFFDGSTYEASSGSGGYREIQRFFEDYGRQWAIAANLPTDGRTVYADVMISFSGLDCV